MWMKLSIDGFDPIETLNRLQARIGQAITVNGWRGKPPLWERKPGNSYHAPKVASYTNLAAAMSSTAIPTDLKTMMLPAGGFGFVPRNISPTSA